MDSPNVPSSSKPYTHRFAAHAILVSAWSIGSVSLVAFFVLFVLLGSLNLADLGLSAAAALAWDALLCLLFFLQYGTMVRRSYQRWSATLIPSHYHGATYTIASGVALLVLVVFWQESAHTLVELDGILRWFLRAVYVLSIAGFAWGILAPGSFDTFGLRPILDRLRGTDSPALPFTVRGPYRWVRHPLYALSLLMIWSMSGHPLPVPLYGRDNAEVSLEQIDVNDGVQQGRGRVVDMKELKPPTERKVPQGGPAGKNYSGKDVSFQKVNRGDWI